MNKLLSVSLLVSMTMLLSSMNTVTAQYPFNMFGGMFDSMFRPMMFTNWYEGPNVCVDEKVIPVSDVESEIAKEFGGNSRDVSQNCRGNQDKYVCVSRITENGQMVQKVRTYYCCPGYVRPRDGSPGCVAMQ